MYISILDFIKIFIVFITPVTPEVDRTSPIIQNPYVSEPIRKYYENSTDLFSYTQPIDKVSDSYEYEGEWMEKTLLQCENQFPAVLRRSEIIESRTIKVTPVESALEDVEMMRQEMAIVNAKFETYLENKSIQKNSNNNYNNNYVNSNLRVENLSMVLNNACDIPNDSGISFYRQAYLNKKEDQNLIIQKLDKCLINLALTIRRGLDLHKVMCTSEMTRFHMTLEKLFVKNYNREISQFPSELVKSSTSPSRSSSFKSFNANSRIRNVSTVTNSSSISGMKSSKPNLSLPRLSSLKTISKSRSGDTVSDLTSQKSPTLSTKSWSSKKNKSKNNKNNEGPQLPMMNFDEEGLSGLLKFSRKH